MEDKSIILSEISREEYLPYGLFAEHSYRISLVEGNDVSC